MFNPTVSVIVNTYNRENHLKRLLDALSHQTYDNFEVIVVNGPSTDQTDKVLEQYKGIIRTAVCPQVNLCISRNIGIKIASGEIIAFIDDDAVPEGDFWIENAVKPFSDPQIGAAGGLVKRINGDIEFAYGVMSIWGDNRTVCHCKGSYETLTGELFNRTAGGNGFFRTSAMVEAGGFDGYYKYFLDEADLCYRIIKHGYKIIHLDNANIYHEAAKSINRKSKYHLNWDIIAQSKGYYVIKSTENCGFSDADRRERARASANEWLKDFKILRAEKKISHQDYDTFIKMVTEGIKQGVEDGFNLDRNLNFNISPDAAQFKPFNKSFSKQFLNICMLCEYDIIKPVGGVPVYTNMMAKQFAKMGHNVHIISRGESITWDNIDGLNIYTVPPENFVCDDLNDKPVCSRILNFSYACFKMSQLLKSVFHLDVLETPIWDCYGLVSAYLEKDIPVVTRLQTPLKMVIDTMNLQQSADLLTVTQFEEALLKRSRAVITISDCIKDTIEDLYAIKFLNPVYKNYLGIEPKPLASASREDSGKIIVYFIGRLERRKGIESILAVAPYFLEKYPDLEFHFAGDCDIIDEVLNESFKSSFFKQYKRAKWLDRVKFMGKISNEIKEQEFADCDIFISPSLYESFGIIFIEAMRYGKPVIGGNVGGMKEIVIHNETGLLCQPGDPKSFQDCLEVLVSDANERKSMGDAGLKRLHEMFTDRIMCEGSIKIYQEILAHRDNEATKDA